jgi:hypothetical protein
MVGGERKGGGIAAAARGSWGMRTGLRQAGGDLFASHHDVAGDFAFDVLQGFVDVADDRCSCSSMG